MLKWTNQKQRKIGSKKMLHTKLLIVDKEDIEKEKMETKDDKAVEKNKRI